MTETRKSSLELDMTLASVMGWTEVGSDTIGPFGLPPKPNCYSGSDGMIQISMHTPRWTLDDRHAFKLIVDHPLTVERYHNCVVVKAYVEEDLWLEHKGLFLDYADKASAIRATIVMAVIEFLSVPSSEEDKP